MASISVRLYTILKEKVGEGKVQVQADTVSDAIDILKKMFGKKFSDQFYEPNGSIKKYFHLLLSGKTIDKKNIKKTKLNEGDILHIFPPIAGG